MSEGEVSIPTQIGPYEILEELGEGGMGSVYRAQHQDTGAVVALKTVRVTKQTHLNNLRREIHTLSRLDHPGIVRIVEQGVESTRPWYAMEFVEGVTLRQYILKHPHAEASQASWASGLREGEELSRSQAPLEGHARLLSTAIQEVAGSATGIFPSLSGAEAEKPEEASAAGVPGRLTLAYGDAFGGATTGGATIGGATTGGAERTGQEEALSKSSGGTSSFSNARWWTHALSETHHTLEAGAFEAPEPKQPSDDAFGSEDDAFGGGEAQEDAFGGLESEADRTLLELTPLSQLMSEGKLPPTGLPKALTQTASLGSELPPRPSPKEADTLLELSPFAPTDELDAILHVILKLCEPLAYLHGNGIVHCDLKPDNVLVRKDGTPVLIDFGLLAVFAGWFNREVADFTLAGLGTIPYMAPEQIAGRLIDARADLYALGCILYELLVGEPPFVGEWNAIIGHHLYSEPTPPSSRRSGIPPELDRLVLQLLAKEPRDRIGHVDAVRLVLHRLVRGQDCELDVLTGPAARSYLFRPEIAGRDQELELLQEHVRTTKKGGVGLVIIGGESGVGKTRLTLEVAQYARSQGLQVMAGECLDHASPPLEAFQPFFMAVADRIREYGAQEQEHLLGEHGHWLSPYTSAFSEFDPNADEDDSLDLVPSQMRMQVFRALGRTMRQFAQKKAMLLVLDDLHWADELTLGVLVHLSRLKGLQGLLVVGTFRTENTRVELHLLKVKESVTYLELQRLDQAAVASIVADMLAMPEVSERFVEYLSVQSEGNPYFIAEFLQAAVEEGLFWRDDTGRWRMSEAVQEAVERGDFSLLPLPSSLQDLVIRRLQDVSDRSSAILAAAAVIGREVPLHLLKQAMKLNLEGLWGEIEALRRRQVMDYLFDGTVYFTHDKIREIVLRGLSAKELKQLHRRAAKSYESLFRGQRAFYSGQIAYHWEQAGQPERARYYYKHGAKQAEARCANDEAARLYRAFLKLPEPPIEEKIEVMISLGQVLEQVGELDQAKEILEQALALTRQHEDRLQEGTALRNLAQIALLKGELLAAEVICEESLKIFEQLENPGARGIALGSLAHVYREKGEFERAESSFQEALELHREAGNTLYEASQLIQYLRLKRMLGEPLHTLEVGLAHAESLSGAAASPILRAHLICERGHLQICAQKSAQEQLEQAEQIASSVGLLGKDETFLGQSIGRLRRAQDAFGAGQGLLFGEDPRDLPEALQPKESADEALSS